MINQNILSKFFRFLQTDRAGGKRKILTPTSIKAVPTKLFKTQQNHKHPTKQINSYCSLHTGSKTFNESCSKTRGGCEERRTELVRRRYVYPRRKTVDDFPAIGRRVQRAPRWGERSGRGGAGRTWPRTRYRFRSACAVLRVTAFYSSSVWPVKSGIGT